MSGEEVAGGIPALQYTDQLNNQNHRHMCLTIQ